MPPIVTEATPIALASFLEETCVKGSVTSSSVLDQLRGVCVVATKPRPPPHPLPCLHYLSLWPPGSADVPPLGA